MPNLGSRLTGVPIDTRGGVEGEGLVVRDGVYVSERVAVPSGTVFSGARIHKGGTDQTNLAHATVVEVTFSTASFDTDSYFSDANDALVIPADGHYLVSAGIAFFGADDAEDLLATVHIDDVEGFRMMRLRDDAGASLSMAFVNFAGSDILSLSAGEEINLKVYTETVAGTNTVDIEGTSTETWLSITRLDHEGSLLAGFSPILDHKPTTDTLDDEFDSTTLDGKWTAVSGSSGTVSLVETGEVEKYDLTTRPGWLLMQAGSAADQKVELRQDLTLADGDSVIMAFSPTTSSDADTGIAANEMRTGISLNDNDAGWDAGEYNTLAWTVQTDGWRIIHWDGSTMHGTTGTTSTADSAPTTQLIYVRMARIGSVLHAYWSSDGATWMSLGSETRSATATNIWIYAESISAASEPVPVIAVGWIRQGTNALDPWSHSPLVSVAQVEDWTTFTPTLDASSTPPTIGNGTLAGRYRRTGNSVEVVLSWIFGSSSAAGSGTYRFKNLPYSVLNDTHVGVCFLTDSGTGILDGHTRAISSDDSVRGYVVNSGGTDNYTAEVSNNYPLTWATGDEWRITIVYETDFS